MLMALGIGKRDVYEDDFEKPFLRESREFFRVRQTELHVHVCCSDTAVCNVCTMYFQISIIIIHVSNSVYMYMYTYLFAVGSLLQAK